MQALFVRSCHEDVIFTRKSHECAGTAFVQGDPAGGSKLIEQTLLTPHCIARGLSQLMAYFENALRQLLESLQSVRRIHPDLGKVRVGHKDYVWLPWQQEIGRFLLGFQ